MAKCNIIKAYDIIPSVAWDKRKASVSVKSIFTFKFSIYVTGEK